MEKKCKKCDIEISSEEEVCSKCKSNNVTNNDLKTKILDNLVPVAAIIMLIGLFVGNFYISERGGGYIGLYGTKGYNLTFNGELWYGFILLLAPVSLLVTNHVEALKKNEKVINLGLTIASIAIIFVIKGQIVSAWGMIGATASLGLGAWIYLLGNIIALILTGLKAAGYKTDAKSLEKMIRQKDLNVIKEDNKI